MRVLVSVCFVLIAAGEAWVFAGEPQGDLRLNQIQVVATHNSYHLRPPANVLKMAISVRKDAKEWDYSRQPLDQQLDHGVRSFELDLHLAADGWQVMHVPMLDAGTTAKTFADALRVVGDWSQAHPRHVPISLLLELKEEGFALSRKYRKPAAADVASLDNTIRETLPAEQLLTPNDVRGKHATLPEAIAADGWPSLADAAGKVFVILHERGDHRAAYLDGHPALEGRAMFVESDIDQPHAAVFIRNDPSDPQIGVLARGGYLVRTRVDSQGRLEPAQRERALASGAHLLTTDYPLGEIELARAFSLPEHAVARVNPITGPATSREAPITEPIVNRD